MNVLTDNADQKQIRR